jgi:hypothetical protein
MSFSFVKQQLGKEGMGTADPREKVHNTQTYPRTSLAVASLIHT